MQPDWKGIDADTLKQAHTAAGKDYVVLMADMFGKGYGDKTKAEPELRAGMLSVHNDLPFTLACGGKAYDTLIRITSYNVCYTKLLRALHSICSSCLRHSFSQSSQTCAQMAA